MEKAEEEMAKKDWTYDFIVWSVVPLQFTLMFYFLNRVDDGSMPLWVKLGMIFAFGMACGVLGINVAHELGHRNTWYEQLMSKMLLATSLYLHFLLSIIAGITKMFLPMKIRHRQDTERIFTRSSFARCAIVGCRHGILRVNV